MFGEEADSVWLSLEMQTETRIRIKITDDKQRFEVPIKIEGDGLQHNFTDVDIKFSNSPVFGLRISRKSTGELLLDTGAPGMVFSDQFIQAGIVKGSLN